jgi:dTDP-glucose pyrophosphorylase
MRRLDESARRILFVVDSDGRFVGSLTDGDIRRALLKNASLQQEVKSAVNLSCVKFDPKSDFSEIAQVLDVYKLDAVPLVGPDSKVVQIIFRDVPRLRSTVKTPVLLMAGGYGKRLLPLSEEIPKPLISFNGTSSLEALMRRLMEAGFVEVSLALHYKAEIIRDQIEALSLGEMDVSYLIEADPLGTAGALCLLDTSIDESVLVINADIVTNLRFDFFVRDALSQSGDTTIAVSQFLAAVPYGLVEVTDGCVRGILEKPQLPLPVFSGITLVNRVVRELVKPNERIDMTDLLRRAIGAGQTVRSVEVDATWSDMGSHFDLTKLQL